MNIYPAILTDSLEEAQHQLDRVRDARFPVHIDIIDGEFVDNITFSPVDVLDLDLHGLLCDFHLMTVDPIQDVVECKEVLGVRTVIAQIERMTSQKDFIDHTRSLGMRVGFSLDLYTPISAMDIELFSQLDTVQVMAIRAGFQGQVFESSVLEKIQELHSIKKRGNYSFEIIVDGGENPSTAAECKKIGADSVTVGSALWKAQDIRLVLDQFSMLS